jgi:hypothetical protein
MVRRLIAAAQETCEVDSDGYTDLGRDEDVEQAKETWMTWPRWKREGFCDRNHLVLIARHESGDSATSSEDNDEEDASSAVVRLTAARADAWPLAAAAAPRRPVRACCDAHVSHREIPYRSGLQQRRGAAELLSCRPVRWGIAHAPLAACMQ